MRIDINYYRDRKNMFNEANYGELSTFSYRHGGIDFSSKMNRIARGLTLDQEGNIILVGFEKFFCYRQLDSYNEELQYDQFLRPQVFYTKEQKEELCNIKSYDNEEIEVLEKLDGTMILLSVYSGELITSTTSSINNEYSNKAMKYFKSLSNIKEIKDYIEDLNVTMVFEHISKYNQIAVKYDTNEDMILLGVVSNDTLEELSDYNTFNFNTPKTYKYTIDEIEYIQRNRKNFEGFVAVNEFGRKIKFKTDWWYEEKEFRNVLNKVRKSISQSEIKVIVNAILRDEVDELYSLQNSDEVLKEYNKVGIIHNLYLNLVSEAEKLMKTYPTPRELNNIKYNKHVKGLAMNILVGRETKDTLYRNYIVEEYGKMNNTELSWEE